MQDFESTQASAKKVFQIKKVDQLTWRAEKANKSIHELAAFDIQLATLVIAHYILRVREARFFERKVLKHGDLWRRCASCSFQKNIARLNSSTTDEVSALVVDIGTSSLRAGYAGDDTPKVVIPTSYGYHKVQQNNTDISMAGASENGLPATSTRYYVGSSGPSVWREGMEVGNPISDGLSKLYLDLSPFFAQPCSCSSVQEFEPIKPLIDHAISKVMLCNPTEHPILVTEPSWNTPANRERMAELMFEEFNVPAFYIANTGVLNAYGNLLIPLVQVY